MKLEQEAVLINYRWRKDQSDMIVIRFCHRAALRLLVLRSLPELLEFLFRAVFNPLATIFRIGRI